MIAVGGSLAGSLAFWMRQKYPSLVSMALASSAPILGYPGLTDQYGWYRVATRTYETQSPGCPNAVRKAFVALRSATAPALSKAYNTCTAVPPSKLRRAVSYLTSVLTGSLAARAESAYPLASS